jgi:hypothetical protein
MTSNHQADKEWMQMLHLEGFTPDEIAAKDCVWMSGIDIADMIGIDYVPDIRPEIRRINALRDAKRIMKLRKHHTQKEIMKLTGFSQGKVQYAAHLVKRA